MRPAVVDGVWEVPESFNFGGDVVEALALDNPRRRALTHVDTIGAIRRLTFHDVALGASRWSGLLDALGVAHGQRILVIVGKTPEWHLVLLGALRLGIVSIPCSEQLRAKDLAYRIEHSDASLVVASRSLEGELSLLTNFLEQPPPVLYLDEAATRITTQRPVAYQSTSTNDHAFILYTSGTTKEPKGVVHTHAYTFAKRMQAEYWLDAQQDDLVWCTAGTGWAKSIWNVLLGPWSCGSEIVLHEGGFDPHERFDLLERLKVTVLCQSPTEYRLMAKLDEIADYDLSHLRHAVSAGEPLNPEVIKRFRDVFGITIHDGYGQTETTLVVCNAPGDEIRPGSMGRPTPGHDVAIIDERGDEVGAGVEGDLAIFGRPPSLFSGYWRAPEETDAVFRGDWYVTGDRATRDKDGYFWFTGRADDVINSAAYRIGPFEVESALLEHPAVAESAVVGKPDAERGQVVKAFVVLQPGFVASDELAVELQEHCKQVTAPYKYPREIAFVDALPRTSSGKIRRAVLRETEVRAARAVSALGEESPPEAASDENARPVREVSAAEAKDEAERENISIAPGPEPETQEAWKIDSESEPERTFEPWPEPSSTDASRSQSTQPEEPGRLDDAEEARREPASEPAAAEDEDSDPESSLVARMRKYDRRGDDAPTIDPHEAFRSRDVEEWPIARERDDDTDGDAA